MNREILFRGKRIDSGEWLEGQYAYLLNPRTKDGEPIKHMILDGTPFGQTVDTSTVGQYTGLTDKNGKRIFEGDILRQKKNGVYGFPFSVVFDDGGFMWNENGRRDFLYQSICDTCDVIGNIHDNPELLEGD